MGLKKYRSAWAEIDLSNLKYNVENIKKKVGAGDSDSAPQLIGVIKADGYGHGSIETATVLRSCGVDKFAVATIFEAMHLRDNGFNESIVVLGLCPYNAAEIIVKYNLTPVVNSYRNVEAISEIAQKQKKEIEVFIAIDTGMGRIGYDPSDSNTVKEIKKIQELSAVKIKGLFSHFATSDEADKSFTNHQSQQFIECYEKCTAAGIDLPNRCLANSGAIMQAPETWFEYVRPGIILYGAYPSKEVDKSRLSIKPVMEVKAKIVRLRKVPAGFTVSYGRNFTAEKETLIATIPLGYADGYPRVLSSKGKVIVNGQYAKVVGNICMDQCMLDVTNIPGVKLGDIVTVMGKDGNCEITATDIADLCGTINYEILCGFGQRLARIYDEGKGEKK